MHKNLTSQVLDGTHRPQVTYCLQLESIWETFEHLFGSVRSEYIRILCPVTSTHKILPSQVFDGTHRPQVSYCLQLEGI